MNLELEILKDHNIRVVVIPSEKLQGSPVSDLKTLTYKNDKYDVLESITYNKIEPIPTLMKLLSSGQYINDSIIWKKYTKSEKIYFLIVEKQ